MKFKELKFPSWEEFKTKRVIQLLNLVSVRVYYKTIKSQTIEAYFINEYKLFSFTEQGLEQAIDWIKQKHQEMVDILCEVE